MNQKVKKMVKIAQDAMHNRNTPHRVRLTKHPHIDFADVTLMNPVPGVRTAKVSLYKRKPGKNWMFDSMMH